MLPAFPVCAGPSLIPVMDTHVTGRYETLRDVTRDVTGRYKIRIIRRDLRIMYNTYLYLYYVLYGIMYCTSLDINDARNVSAVSDTDQYQMSVTSSVNRGGSPAQPLKNFVDPPPSTKTPSLY